MPKELCLVTGGAGFIGSHLCEALLKKGKKVRIIDNLSAGKLSHIAAFKSSVEFFKGDIRSIQDCRKAVAGVSYAFHQAAMRSVPKSVDRPVDAHENNATGTLNLLIAAKDARVKRLVYASTSSAYGDCKKFPQKEDAKPEPVSPYAASKLAGEHYCVLFSKTYGLETTSLRYFNVFGPRQDPESQYSVVVPKFMELAWMKKPLEVHWDGRQSRDFSHIENVVQANLLAAFSKNGAGEVFNVANGNSYSLLDLIHVIEKIVGRKLQIKHLPKRQGDVRKTQADISKIKRVLGYKPKMNFEEGLKDTWNYFVKNYFSK